MSKKRTAGWARAQDNQTKRFIVIFVGNIFS